MQRSAFIALILTLASPLAVAAGNSANSIGLSHQAAAAALTSSQAPSGPGAQRGPARSPRGPENSNRLARRGRSAMPA